MPVTPEEYRLQNPYSKTVKLESGSEFVIRKLKSEVMAELLSTLEIRIEPGMKLEQFSEAMEESVRKEGFQKRLFASIKTVVPAGSLEPRIVPEYPAPDGALSLDELTIPDQIDLFMEIIDFQGLPESAKK